MRAALVDNPAQSLWADAHNRFRPLLRMLAEAGYEAKLFDAPLTGERTLVAGSERESDVLPLLAAARTADMLMRVDADIFVFPLRGGLAHGLLMARACGEIPFHARIALWCDTPSRALYLDGDATGDNLQPLVADALERACLELADALLVPDESRARQVEALGVELPPILVAPPPIEARVADAARAPQAIEEIVFVGAFERGAGVVAFIDAIESLAASNSLGDRRIAFVGPIENPAFAAGKEWLGLRAGKWTFPFSVAPTRNRAEALSYCAAPGRLPVLMAHDPEESSGVFGASGGVFVQLGEIATNDLGVKLAELIARRLSGEAVVQSRQDAAPDWSALLASVSNAPVRRRASATRPATLSICTVHYERPTLLAAALESIDSQGAEIIVVDNASRSLESAAALARIESAGVARVERLRDPLPYPIAYNHAACFAQNEFLVFLDDDNAFKPGGLARLRRACETGQFDVIVSNLDLIETANGLDCDCATTLVFVGPARSVGLFFNGFGDTCLAIRRDAFERIGGFRQSAGAYPTADWIMLARAQAQGLKIGVLQTPAFRYRRDQGPAETNWQKFDQHGVRSLVLQSYGAAYDPLLVAKYAQGLWLAGR